MSLRSKVIAHTAGNRLFWLMLSGIVMMASLYMYFVNQTVVRVAERNEIEAQISTMKTEIANLESDYISEKSGITLELVSALGYSEASDVVYVPKKAVSVALGSSAI